MPPYYQHTRAFTYADILLCCFQRSLQMYCLASRAFYRPCYLVAVLGFTLLPPENCRA